MTEPIQTFINDGLHFTIKNDGYDYFDLYQRIRNKQMPVHVLLYDDPEHYVYRIEENGRHFVFKRFGELDGKFDTKLWRLLAGPFYSNLLKQVNTAIHNGCTVIPGVYLVAEKMVKGLSHDNYVLLEYIQGAPIEDEDIPDLREAVRSAFVELHRHGLSLGNVKTGNLVLRPDGTVAIIDLSTRGTHWIGKAKDALKLRLLWNISIPVHSHIAYLFAWGQYQVMRGRRWFMRLRGKKKVYCDWITKIPKK